MVETPTKEDVLHCARRRFVRLCKTYFLCWNTLRRCSRRCSTCGEHLCLCNDLVVLIFLYFGLFCVFAGGCLICVLRQGRHIVKSRRRAHFVWSLRQPGEGEEKKHNDGNCQQTPRGRTSSVV